MTDDSSTRRDSESSSRLGWSVHLLLGACTLLAILARGYVFGKEDQNLYLPFVMHWMDPSLLPHDLLLSLGYARESVVWSLLALSGRVVPLEALLLGLYMAVSYLVLLLAYKTAVAWWGGRSAGWIAVFLWMPAYVVPGVANTTFDDYFTTRILGTLAGMSALYAMTKRRDALAGLFVFMGGLAHIISVVPLTGGMMLAHFMGRRWRALALVLLGFMAAAGGLVFFGSLAGQHHELFQRYSGTWLEIVQRAAPEIFPHLWTRASWMGTILYPLFLVALLAMRKKDGNARPMIRVAAWVCGGVLVGEGIGLCSSIWALTFPIQLCLFRGQWILLYVLALLLSGTLADALEGAGPSRIMASLGSAALWASGDLAFQAAGLCLALALGRREDLHHLVAGARSQGSRLLGLLSQRFPADPQKRALAGLVGLFAIIVVLQLGQFMGWWALRLWLPERRAWVMALAVSVPVAVRVCRPTWWNRIGSRWLVTVFAIQLALIPSPFIVDSLREFRSFRRLYGVPILSEVIGSAARAREAEARAAMGRLVERSVPKGAVVLIPPDWMDFRLLSRRSPYVTFKDGAPVAYDEEYASLWFKRIREIHGVSESQEGWRKDPSLDLSVDELQRLALSNRDIGLDYLVTNREYDLPVVGNAVGFRLYRIGGGGQ